jgi:hypothetical protein
MAELLKAVVSWPSLLLVVVVFGCAPGFFLRLFVLAYRRSDPRRAELIAELYAVPRIERPLWVAEQLEVALFEGLVPRVLAAIRQVIRRPARARVSRRLVGRAVAICLGGQCVQVTRSGARCRNRVLFPHARCHMHRKSFRMLDATFIEKQPAGSVRRRL